MTSNITITRGSDVVTIQTISIDESYDKKVNIIKIPTTGTTPKDNKSIDLLMITHSFDIEGALDSVTDKNLLETIFKGRGVISFAYANALTSPITAIIEKLSIKEATTDETSPTYFAVRMSITECVNLGM